VRGSLTVEPGFEGWAGSPNRFGRALGVVLVLIGLGLLASAAVRNEPSLTTALLGGEVLMSGLMTWADAERNLRRRLAFAAIGAVLMALYMLRR
jgi:uncharacterized membrane protein YidH (DUF202 family)